MLKWYRSFLLLGQVLDSAGVYFTRSSMFLVVKLVCYVSTNDNVVCSTPVAVTGCPDLEHGEGLGSFRVLSIAADYTRRQLSLIGSCSRRG